MAITREQYLLGRRRMRLVMEYMDAHLDDEHVSLDRLAEVAMLSRYHFERLYAMKVRESPMATLRRLRLQRARQALMRGEARSITDLAVQAGYGSVAAFSRAFSRAFRQSPTRIETGLPEQPASLEIVALPAIPVLRHPFTGPAADVFEAGHEINWQLAKSGARHWRHWVVHPDGWVDPARWPERWVRMWHCIPSRGLPKVQSVESGHLPPGRYARFVLQGKLRIDVPELAARVAAETHWQPFDGPMLRHYPIVPDYTPVSERVTHFYLPVAPQS